MNKVNLKENKEIILKLLEYLDKICRDNHIQYSLGAGTLLGAIRNHGFIPWDDDGDVILLRSEYDKLVQILSKTQNADFGFVSEYSKGYYYTFSKIYYKKTWLKTLAPQDAEIQNLGVYIDLFPLDKTPSNKGEMQEFYDDAMTINYRMFMAIPGFYSYNKSSMKHFLKAVLYYPKSLYYTRGKRNPEFWQRRLLKEIKKFENKNVTNAGFILSEYSIKESMNSSIFSSYEDIYFENKKFRKIKRHNDYLHSLYGDYMKLPPVEKRKPKHAYIEYWKDQPRKG